MNRVLVCILAFILAAVLCLLPAMASTWGGEIGEDRLHKSYPAGNLYKLRECFVYIPLQTNKDTRICVHYAGGNGAYILRWDYVEGFCDVYTPTNIYIWYKGSCLDTMESSYARTVTLLQDISDITGAPLDNIVYTGSSNGGYTALKTAARLYLDYGITADKVCTLDMGLNWGLTIILPTAEEYEALEEMQTEVYAFEQHDEIYRYFGARTILRSGIPVYEVICKNNGHEAITAYAFHMGVFAWLTGEKASLDRDEYTIRDANAWYAALQRAKK